MARKIKLKDLEVLKKIFLERAKKLGLLEDFLFVSRYQEYCTMLQRLKDLNQILDEEGYHEVVPVVRGESKVVTHHSYSDYLKTDANVQKIATYLRDAIEKAQKAMPPQPIEDDEL